MTAAHATPITHVSQITSPWLEERMARRAERAAFAADYSTRLLLSGALHDTNTAADALTPLTSARAEVVQLDAQIAHERWRLSLEMDLPQDVRTDALYAFKNADGEARNITRR